MVERIDNVNEAIADANLPMSLRFAETAGNLLESVGGPFARMVGLDALIPALRDDEPSPQIPARSTVHSVRGPSRRGGGSPARRANRLLRGQQQALEDFYGMETYDADYSKMRKDDDSDGIGSMLIRLANMQKDEARRRASDAEDYVKSAAEMTLDDFKLLREQSTATTDRNKASALGRLNDGLESMGINTANAADSLAGIGIDAQKTAEEVGGQTGAALYTIYNMGADLADNLAAISMETLDTAVSQVDNALSGALYNISNNLSASLAQIDQALLAKQISGAEAAQAAKKAEEKARQEAQLDIQLSKIIGDMTNMDPLAAFAADRLGINFGSLIPEPPEIPEPSYSFQGMPVEALTAILGLMNPNAKPMYIDDLSEFVTSLNQPQE